MGFHKWGYPKILPLKWMMNGHPYLRKAPYVHGESSPFCGAVFDTAPRGRFVGLLLRRAELLPLLPGLFGHLRNAVGTQLLHNALAVVLQPTWGWGWQVANPFMAHCV